MDYSRFAEELIDEAIDRSILENRIIQLGADTGSKEAEALEDELLVRSDDHAEIRKGKIRYIDVWGDDPEDWRIRLRIGKGWE